MENTEEIINGYLERKETPRKSVIEDITNYEIPLSFMNDSIELGRGYSPISMKIPSPLKSYGQLFYNSPSKKSDEQLTEYDLFSSLGDNTFDRDIKKLLSRGETRLPDLEDELKSYGLDDEKRYGIENESRRYGLKGEMKRYGIEDLDDNYGDMWKQTHKVIQTLPKSIKSNKEFEKYDRLLQSSIEKVISKLKQQKSENLRLQEKIKDSNRNTEEMKEKVERLERESRDQRSRSDRANVELRRRTAELEREAVELRRRNEEQAGEVVELRRRNEEQAREALELRRRNEESERANRELRAKNERLLTEIVLLKQKHGDGKENEMLRQKLLKYKNLYTAERERAFAGEEAKGPRSKSEMRSKLAPSDMRLRSDEPGAMMLKQTYDGAPNPPESEEAKAGTMFARFEASNPSPSPAPVGAPVAAPSVAAPSLHALQQQVNHLQHVLGTSIEPCNVCLKQMTANEHPAEHTQALMGEYSWP